MRKKNRKAPAAPASILDQLEPRVLFAATSLANDALNGFWFYAGMNQGSQVDFDGQGNMSVGPVEFAWVDNSTASNMTTSFTTTAGTDITPTGRFDVNSDGTLSITFTRDSDNDPNNNNDIVEHYVASVNSTLDVITLLTPGTGLTAGILVKAASVAFANSDFNGTWNVFNNGENAAGTSAGSLNFNGQGQITSGTIKSGTTTYTVLAGAYSVTAAGVVRASVFTTSPSGQKTFNYAGQVNPSRDIVGLHPQDLAQAKTDGDPLVTTWVRRATVAPQSTLTGLWNVAGDGFSGDITVDATGKITGANITNAAGHVIANPTGKLTITTAGVLTLNLTLKDGNVTTNIVQTGTLNASRNLAALEKAPSVTSGDSLTWLSRFGNHAPTMSKVNPFSNAVENTPYTITFAQLLAASNAFDIDNDALGIVIQSIGTGTVKVNNVAVTPGTTTMHAGDTLTWTPGVGAGLINAFAIRVTDGTVATTNDVGVAINTVKLPVVSIVATKSTATEVQGKPNNFVQYKISRVGGVLSQPLTVKFTSTGDLPTDGSGFNTTSAIGATGSITIPANKTFITITLTPLDNAVAESDGKRILTLNLAVGTNTLVTNSYGQTLVLAQRTATVTILDHNEAPTINITGNITGAHINTPFVISVADLLDYVNADDRESGDDNPITLKFNVRPIIGKVQLDDGTPDETALTTGVVTLSTGHTLTWVPPASASGAVNALSVQVFDGFSKTPFKTLRIVLT